MTDVTAPPPGNSEKLLPINIEDEMRRVVSRLRHERHHRPRPAGRARRPQARAPPHPVRHARAGQRLEPRLSRSRPASSATSSVSTTRTATRRSTTPWCAWPRTSPCATRWSTARATSAPSTATRRRPCGTPKPAWRSSPRSCSADIDKETVDFGPNYDDSTAGAAGPARARSRTCWSTARAGIAVGMATNIPPHNLARGHRRHHRADRQPRARASTS